MPSSLDPTRDWLKNVLRPYPSRDRILQEVLDVLQANRTLAVKTDAYTFDSGQTALLLQLHGTLPINYRGAVYQIPVVIWLQHEYPRAPPMAYVTPTRDMGVRKGREVEPGGRVREEVVAEWWAKWSAQQRDLKTFIAKLVEIFSLVPPVYSKPPGAATNTTGTSSRSGSMSGLPAAQSAAPAPVAAGSAAPPPPTRPSFAPPNGHLQEALPQYRPAPIPPTNESHARQASGSYPAYTPSPQQSQSPPPPQQSPSVPLRPGQQPPLPQRPAFYPGMPRSQSPQVTSPTSASGQNGVPWLTQHQHSGMAPQHSDMAPQHSGIAPQHSGQYGMPAQHSGPLQGQYQQPGYPKQQQPPPQQYPQHPPHQQYPQQGYPAGPPGHQRSMSGPIPPQPGQPGPPPAQVPQHMQTPVRAAPQPPVDLLSSPEAATSAPLPDDAPPPIPPSKPPPPSLLHLHSILLPHLNAALPPLMHQLQGEKQHLLERHEDLASGEPAIKDEMARLEAVKKVCDAVGKRLDEVVGAGEARVADLENRGEVSVDEVVCSISIVHNQLIDLVAEDNALSDTIYHLTRALDAERIDLDRYLKAVRQLAREQYMKRALIERIEQGMGQSQW